MYIMVLKTRSHNFFLGHNSSWTIPKLKEMTKDDLCTKFISFVNITLTLVVRSFCRLLSFFLVQVLGNRKNWAHWSFAKEVNNLNWRFGEHYLLCKQQEVGLKLNKKNYLYAKDLLHFRYKFKANIFFLNTQTPAWDYNNLETISHPFVF